MTPPNMAPAATRSAGISIVSFGYLHGEPPSAHLTIDLRHHFRDPHVNPELRYMTAADEPVRAAVLSTPGIQELLDAVAGAVVAFAAGPSAGPVTLAVGCAGGRHRSAVFADTLGQRMTASGHEVAVSHRDLGKPVVERSTAVTPESGPRRTTVVTGNTGQVHTGRGDQITNYPQR